MTTLNVGYVGLDHLHRDPFLALIHQLPIELVCVCEPNSAFDVSTIREPDERPDEVDLGGVDVQAMVEGVPLYTDPGTMFRDEDLDVVWITLPNRDTPGVIRSALEHGLHVIAEKPGARTAEELEALQDVAAEHEVTVGVNYFYRQHPIVAELRSLAADGFFGQLRTVDARYLGSTLDFREPDHFIYDQHASRGGALQWLGSHWIDLFLYVLDDPIERVNANMTRADSRIDVEDGTTLQFETRSGGIGTYVTGYYLQDTVKDTAFDVFGTAGRAKTTLGRDEEIPLALQDYTSDSDDATAWTSSYTYTYDRFPVWGDPVLTFYEEMIEAFDDNRRPPADLEDAIGVLSVLDAAYESAGTGEWASTGL